MDSTSRLDYALFQLTPTRTRCDLVICAGDCKEKLASGLLEPFISHLKFAKDQISKGGYSITLSAPDSASWFTKSTLERFVRFVSTPEVLERFIAIEREIANIDRSINTNADDSQSVYGFEEQSNTYKHEWNTSDAIHEEDSKVHLQRVLETRKAVLQKEQAMVYARALVVGFETDNLEDLICFSDAFGSPRLREACLNYMELCNAKSNDRVWMDEVAAMQAYSRSQHSYMGTSSEIILPGEDEPSQELRINVHNGYFDNKKQNGVVDSTASDSSISHGSHYMHAYQSGPMFRPPYPGYPFPGMVVPPYYQGNLPWPPNVEDTRSRGKRSRKKGSRELKQDSDSSDSSFGSDSSSYKRSSSRKVVIRNINYITSDRDGKAEQDFDDDSSNGVVNRDLDRTVNDKREDQNVTQQWDIFQNLLMKDEDEKEFEEVKIPYDDFSESFVIIEKDSFSENNNHARNLRPGEDRNSVVKKHNTSKDEFVSRIFEEPDTNPSRTRPEFATKSSSIGRYQEGDWFSGSRPDKVIQEKSRDIFEDHFRTAESTKDVLVIDGDPLAVQARTLNKSSDSQLRTQDILMVSEGNMIQKVPSSPNRRVEATFANEPNDLYMVLERDTAIQQAVATWTPEMESTDINVIKHDSAEDGKLQVRGKEPKSRPKALVGQSRERKASTNEAKPKALVGSLGKSKSDIISRNKISTGTKATIPKGKSQKEEEKRKKMEELLTQRQKRIAERTQRSASTTKPVKSEDPKARLASRDMKKPSKPVIKSSTIDRLSAARVVNHKVLPTDSKPGNTPMKVTTKKNGEAKPVRLSAAHVVNHKVLPAVSKPGNKPMKVTTKKNGEAKPVSKPKKAPTREDGQSKPGKIPTKVATRENAVSRTLYSQRPARAEKKDVKPDKAKHVDKNIVSNNSNGLKKKIADLNNVKQLPKKASDIGIARNRLSAPPNHQSKRSDNTKGLNESLPKSSVRQNDIALSDRGGSAKKTSNSVSFRINEDNDAKGNPVVKVNHEILMMETSTPPPGKGSPERSNPRKKWSSVEASTKALSGFKKLLSFGRRH